MNTKNKNVVSPEMKARRKKGQKYILIAVAFLVVLLIMHSGGIQGGILWAIVDLAMFYFLIVGLIYLIRGFFGKG